MYEKILSFLQKDFTEPIRDPLWRNIHLTQGLLDLAASEQFQQLGRIRQLGPAFHVYPGAVHTRLNHSFGVLQTAKKVITSLIILSGRESVTEAGLTLTGVRSFLAAAMLHDLGHFPFTHSLKELPLKEHEKLSGEIILSDHNIRRILSEKVEADPEMTAAIIDPSLSYPHNELTFYRNLLSGALDPDKLDYLNRDAYFCGVPYGHQDVDFIIDRLRIIGKDSIGILESGTGAIEHLLFSKYLMYRKVYWHRTVRSATAMIKSAIIHALELSELRPEDLYNLDDASFNSLCLRKAASSSSPLELITQVMHRNLYSCAAEIAFCSDNPVHRSLENLEIRVTVENEISRYLSKQNGSTVEPWEVIIDIPETISFEANIPIIGKRGDTSLFSQASSVFSNPVIEGFSKSLRRIRLFVPEKTAAAAEAAQILSRFLV